jgi:hypothetical protein
MSAVDHGVASGHERVLYRLLAHVLRASETADDRPPRPLPRRTKPTDSTECAYKRGQFVVKQKRESAFIYARVSQCLETAGVYAHAQVRSPTAEALMAGEPDARSRGATRKSFIKWDHICGRILIVILAREDNSCQNSVARTRGADKIARSVVHSSWAFCVMAQW